jgi:hypothetical protein
VNWYIDGGFNFKGFIPGRNRDVAGVAVAHSAISQDFSDAQVLLGNPGFSSETVLEATYNYSIPRGGLSNRTFNTSGQPSAENGSQDAAVFGIRTVISF